MFVIFRNCDDYDLCEECEPLEGIHNADHVFLKIRRPTVTAGRRKNGELAPLLKRTLYGSSPESPEQADNVSWDRLSQR